MTISEVRGWGVRQSDRNEESHPVSVEISQKLKVEMVVPADEVDANMDRVHEAIRTADVGTDANTARRADDLALAPARRLRDDGRRRDEGS